MECCIRLCAIVVSGAAFALFISCAQSEADDQESSATKGSSAQAGETITLTILYDNNEYDRRLETAWGFSCLVKGLEKTILFDTGGDGSMLLSNMRKLGIAPKEVDLVVISHIHGDHLGGLRRFLEKNHEVTVYLPASFPQDIKRGVTQSGAKLVEVRRPLKICKDAYSTGELGTWMKEQSLVIETSKGLLLITGCAHPGVVNVIRQSKKMCKRNVYLVLGGFHLCGMNAGQIGDVVRDVKAEGVPVVSPCHCSGDLARRIFERAYGKNFILTGVGKTLRLATTPRKVCVYAGTGAVYARDVEAALRRLSISCTGISEGDIKRGRLKECATLIIPGAQTRKVVNALGKEGCERIKEFVGAGGTYIGICAGAYLAAERVEVTGRPPGLGIVDIKNVRKSRKAIVTIHVTAPEHPLVKGCNEDLRIWYQNGPLMKPGKGVETIAVYPDGSAAVVCATYGKGRVILFSPHPEGSLKHRVDPAKLGTLRLLENAISLASRSPK